MALVIIGVAGIIIYMKTRINLLLAVLLAALPTAARSASSPLETLTRALPGYVAVVPAPQPPKVAAGITGEQLFQQLHTETVMTILPGGHDYGEAKNYMFSKADNTGCGSYAGVTCLYSQVCAKGATGRGEDYKENGDANGDGTVSSDGMNAEHSWPQGFFDKAYPMKSDLHHIFPTFIKPNNTRGSQPYGPVARPTYTTSNGSKFDGKVFEPADKVKGDIARAILYFVVRYNDRKIHEGVNYRDFWTNRVQMFLDWNRQDPPDAAEKLRNDQIFRYQGNRNPFVDDATLADKVGLAVFQAH